MHVAPPARRGSSGVGAFATSLKTNLPTVLLYGNDDPSLHIDVPVTTEVQVGGVVSYGRIDREAHAGIILFWERGEGSKGQLWRAAELHFVGSAPNGAACP